MVNGLNDFSYKTEAFYRKLTFIFYKPKMMSFIFHFIFIQAYKTPRPCSTYTEIKYEQCKIKINLTKLKIGHNFNQIR